ncbi:MAG: transcriptional regulator, partial [Chitinophagaceae bacterium]
VNDQLLMGHHNGAFLIENNAAKLLDNSSGFWTFLPVSSVLPSSLMVAGNYRGLDFFDFKNGRFSKNKVTAQFESARFVVVENEKIIWVAHPYKGIYRIELQPNQSPLIKLYNQRSGLSANNNYVFKIKNRIVAATQNGLYEYNEQKDSFEPSAYFKNILDQKNVRYLKEDPAGNIWFVHGKELGVVDFQGAKPKIIHFPELNNKLVSGFENIYALDKHNIIIGGERGFYHVDFAKYKQQRTVLQTQFRLVRSIGKKDSSLYGGNLSPAETRLPYSMNSLHFEYSATLYGQQSIIEYSYYLNGFDKGWSNWSGKPEKDYTNLPAGSYVFQVKSRNNLGNESAVTSFAFTILPPWYQTPVAYVVYALLFLGLVYYLHRHQRKKFLRQKDEYENQQKQLQYLHQLELEKNEKEIVKLKNEKLEAEIGHKNSELANSAMHLVQKREMLGKLRDDLSSLLKKIDNEKVSSEFKKVLKMMGEDDKIDENWEHFAHHF